MNRLRPRPAWPGLHDDRGTALTWLLGLLMMVLALGGLSVDLWRAFSDRRLVAGVVDAAAVAGASGVDEDHLRSTGEARLDPVLARQRASAALAAHSGAVESPAISIAPDGSSITVSGSREVRLTLARLIDPSGNHRVGAEATSSPRRAP
jgi:Flp pilus assembly protein TadG